MDDTTGYPEPETTELFDLAFQIMVDQGHNDGIVALDLAWQLVRDDPHFTRLREWMDAAA